MIGKGFTKDTGPDVDRFIWAVQEIAFAIAQHIDPEMVEGIVLQTHAHKKEIREGEAGKPPERGGILWYTEACASDREARVLFNGFKAANKRKQVYMYLGGGQVSPNQTPLLSSVLLLTKTHDWLAVVCVALYLIGSCGASFVAPWPRTRFITTGGEIAAGAASDLLSAGPAAAESETGSVQPSRVEENATKDAFISKCSNMLTTLIDMSTRSGIPVVDGSLLPPREGDEAAMGAVRTRTFLHERDNYRTFLRAWGEAREGKIRAMH